MATGTILLAMPPGFDSAAPAGFSSFNSKPRILFDDTDDEIVHWTFRMPENYASAPVIKIQYAMASAISGTVIISCEVMAVSDGDSALVDTDSYAALNTSAGITVPATTAGRLDEISLTLTNADSLAAGDFVALRFRREAADTATGDMEVIAATLEYTTT